MATNDGKLTSAGLSDIDRQHRMNIRNAWLAESVTDIRAAAVDRAAQGKWFEAAVLFELALDD